MSMKQAAYATAGLMVITAALFGWWTYDLERTRMELNDAYLDIATRTRNAEASARKAHDAVDTIELDVLRLEDELDKVQPKGTAINKAKHKVLATGLRARANTLQATLQWLNFSLDSRIAQQPEMVRVMGDFDPYRLSLSRLRRVADTWIMEGEAISKQDVTAFAKRLKASPHLKNIDIIETRENTDNTVGQTFTRYRLTADIVVRPELTFLDNEDTTQP
jgi:hypothetical protein